MRSKKWTAVILMLLLVFGSAQAAFAEQHGKSLKIAVGRDESTLTPYTYQSGYPGLDLMNLLYDNLFQLDEKNIPQPWLVKEYTVSEDGLTYNFTLLDSEKFLSKNCWKIVE